MTSRSVLVSGQVAVATVLLFISILVLRSLHSIGEVDPGFSIDGVVTARIDLDQGRYAGDERLRFAAETFEAARRVPGVSASITNLIPFGGDVNSTVYTVERGQETTVETYVMHIGPDYFKTVNIRLQRGRDFSMADRDGAPGLAILNAAFVRAHGLALNPLGARIRNGITEPWLDRGGRR